MSPAETTAPCSQLSHNHRLQRVMLVREPAPPSLGQIVLQAINAVGGYLQLR